ncbi:hypothetical protein BURMUCF1_B0118 [Burkholderia multivorans ATCC BAA-247]|nr:hypothetical protein BURMUCF1_B0118 [Burkholderia multivorans ATCC BAA-247]
MSCVLASSIKSIRFGRADCDIQCLASDIDDMLCARTGDAHRVVFSFLP